MMPVDLTTRRRANAAKPRACLTAPRDSFLTSVRASPARCSRARSGRFATGSSDELDRAARTQSLFGVQLHSTFAIVHASSPHTAAEADFASSAPIGSEIFAA